MDNPRLDRIETRLDSIDANLATHMKRSDALEAQVAPMKELMLELRGVVKFLKLAGVIVALIEAFRMLK